MRITSRDNRQMKEIGKLYTSGRFRKENGLFVVEGERICWDAAETGIPIRTLVLSDTGAVRYSETARRLERMAGEVISVPDVLFSRISDTVHPQGILCVCEIPAHRLTSEGILPGRRYVALENLSDPANLGTIARTGEALGIDGLILSADCCDPYSPKALRAGMGSLIRIPLLKTEDFFGVLRDLQARGISSYAAVPAADAMPVTRLDLSSGVVLIGNEGNGLTPEAKALATHCVTIPMGGKAESLNAAAAASILMWEMMRRG